MAKTKEKKTINKKTINKNDEVLETKSIKEKIEYEKFKLEGIDYIPYVLGWILGVFNLIFWIILLIVALVSENKHRFIDYTLHKFVYIYGIIMIVLILIFIFFIILLLMLGITLFGPMMMLR